MKLTITRNLLIIPFLILVLICFQFGSMVLVLFFYVLFPLIIAFIFEKLNNFNEKQYMLVVVVVLSLFTIIYSILVQTNSLTSIGTYLLLLVGLIYAFMMTPKVMAKHRLLKEGIKLMKENKFEESLNKFDCLLKLDPNNYIALFNRTQLLAMTGKLDESIGSANEILRKNPDDYLILSTKAHVLLKLGKTDESLKIIERIITESSDDNLLYVAIADKGEIFSQNGQYSEAITYYKDALDKSSTKKKSYLERRGVMVFKKIYLKDQIRKQIAEIWLSKGKAHKKLKQHDEALKSYEEALKLDPENQEVLNAKKELLEAMN
ncbi:tetratricopeptide repeat protein [uncultured Methanobacterium sp.]|uniref:tetratricopeptide repeat protein n=1 Tax=uncultured Methanobacterium sp. TaxID=176306 RepID=UPI002AA7A430|nr:tetratricopeptide repeat protein [uncultured Methanobacterium sp.]